jgi:hypothetical protein
VASAIYCGQIQISVETLVSSTFLFYRRPDGTCGDDSINYHFIPERDQVVELVSTQTTELDEIFGGLVRWLVDLSFQESLTLVEKYGP